MKSRFKSKNKNGEISEMVFPLFSIQMMRIARVQRQIYNFYRLYRKKIRKRLVIIEMIW